MDIYPIQSKHCKKCNTILSIDNFHKDKDKKDGLKTQCKNCEKIRKKLTYKPAIPIKLLTVSSGYHHCKKCDTTRPITEFSKDKSKPNGISYTCKYCRKSYQDKYHPEYFQNNKSKRAEYAKNRRATDPMYRFKSNVRSLVYNAFYKKGYSKKSKTFSILGCSYEQFIIHLETQFTDGMKWDNYGEWVIDHIIPLASALTESDIITLNYYTNLQPLWATDNLAKSDKLDWIKPL